jgi:protein involved in polysaccharide export with SLBB domain
MGMVRPIAVALLAACAGCASNRPRIVAALDARSAQSSQAAAAYAIACPDVVAITAAGRPDLSGRYAVAADGTVPVGVPVRVEGCTPAAAAQRIAAATGAAHAHVAVAEYRSRQVFLLGPVAGSERALPYQGPETVVELLRRGGGLAPGANVGEVHVVRSHVAGGRRPEVFPVDLEAILLDNDAKTNVRVEPFDQVYVGESRQAFLARHLPFGPKEAAKPSGP